MTPPVVAWVSVGVLLALIWAPLVARGPWGLWFPLAGLAVATAVGSWLGLAVAYVVLRSVPDEFARWTAVSLVVGVALLALVARAPREAIRLVLLVTLGLEMAILFWRPAGTFGTPAEMGALVAAVAPLAPFWMLPLVIVGLAASHSYLAAMAAFTGLWIGVPTLRLWLVAAAGLALVGYACLGLKSPLSAWHRLQTWGSGLSDLRGAWLFGHGPGSWNGRMWNLWCPCPPGEVWTAAHNEPLQWVYETGAVGAALLVLVLRRASIVLRQAPPMWQGAAAAVAVLSLGLQVFHLPTLAAGMLLVLGGALSTSTTGGLAS